MKKKEKLLALLLALVLALSLPATALAAEPEDTESAETPAPTESGENIPAEEAEATEEAEAAEEAEEAAPLGESALLICAEGESLVAAEGTVICARGGVVFNNGATVYNNGGVVYNNFGLVYNNDGTTFNNSGTVYVNGGTVYNNAGSVVFNNGRLIDNAAPAEEEAPAEEAAPAEEEVPAAEEAPAEEEIPVEEEVPAEEEAPVEEEVPAAEEAPAEPEAPAADLEAGVYAAGTELRLRAGEGAVIRYTLDGSEPDEQSEEYAAPIVLDGSAVLTARAFYEGGAESALFSADYTVPVLTAPLFEPLTQGYGHDALPAAAAALENDGTRPFTIIGARVNGNRANCFTVTAAKDVTVAPGERDDSTFLVSPTHGLAAGEYTARLVLILSDGRTLEVPFSLTVVKG